MEPFNCNNSLTLITHFYQEKAFHSQLQYKLKRCSNKECCKQCRYVMFKGTMTKWPVQKLTQGTTQKLLQHHDVTDI